MTTAQTGNAPPIIQWTPEYAVGVVLIDEEHQRLFSLVEGLHQAMLAGKGKEILGRLLAGLIDYTCYHFKHEEDLMARIRYPDLPDHFREHEDLRQKVRALHDRFACGEAAITIETMQFLSAWLKRHTTTRDRRIGAYMESHGLSPVR